MPEILKKKVATFNFLLIQSESFAYFKNNEIMKSTFVMAIAMLLALGIYAQVSINSLKRSGSVVIVMDGRTVLEIDQSEVGFSTPHLLIVLNEFGDPILTKSFNQNSFELDSSEIRTQATTLILSTGNQVATTETH